MSENNNDSQKVFNLFYGGRNVLKAVPGSGVWNSPSIRKWGMGSFLSLQMPAGVPVIHTQSCLACVSMWWSVGWNLGECFLLGTKSGLFSSASCTAHRARGLHRLSDREQHPTLSSDLQAWWVLGCPHGTTCDLFGITFVEERKGEFSLSFSSTGSTGKPLRLIALNYYSEDDDPKFLRTACLSVPHLCELGQILPDTYSLEENQPL